jgi:hypothetical protein
MEDDQLNLFLLYLILSYVQILTIVVIVFSLHSWFIMHNEIQFEQKQKSPTTSMFNEYIWSFQQT